MVKKLLTAFLLLVLTAGHSFAQLNGNVEAWDSAFSTYEEPANWVSVNLFKVVDATNPRSVYKLGAGFAIEGAYSMRIKTVHLNNNPSQGMLPDNVGICMQGSFSLSPLGLRDRNAYTARPATFHYVYQYKPVGVDTGFVYVELTKWNTSLGRRDTIAQGGFYHTTLVNAWATQTFPLYYLPNHPATMTPDSIAVIFSSSSYVAPQLGSEFWADAVYFTGWTGVQDMNAASAHVSMFPNPAKDNITITADVDNAYSIVVYDGIGKTVGKFEMENKKYILNTSNLRAGNYYFSVMDKSGAVLTGNTFSVIK